MRFPDCSRGLRTFTLLLALVLAAPLPAQATPADAEREITALIAGLRDSPCRFQRNGRWHDGARAAAHLRRKYDYVRERGGVDSAEAFIELAASRSSFTGRPYRVQCGEAAAIDAGAWFRARLALLRGPKPRGS
ncbi:DUF5329 domain-containing protein [Arenimonas terrae]|uniref:DUF5329 domain-containing protein n=1 Tax=Arenimonas terrae TaxID=2546226 RepID=A0A5C4RSP8_9GAMM|nr:DUF5329 domain-containing protein [Arenimonas terrae]TNJ33955.1 hypothetical protein E1B00_11550 [Arenimonas terrae]